MEMSHEITTVAQVADVNSNRIDAAAAIKFKDMFKEASADNNLPVILNLTQVDFVDSSGLGAIVAAMKHLGGDRKMRLVGLSPMVTKVFSLTRMDRIFPIFETVEDALEDVHA